MGEILNLIESVSGGFPSYFCCALAHTEKGFPSKAQFYYISFMKFVHLVFYVAL